MSADPLVVVQSSKPLTVSKALERVLEFTSSHSTLDISSSSILSKQQRLCKPSEDVVEKLKVLTISIEEDMSTYRKECTKQLLKKSKRKSEGDASRIGKKRRSKRDIVT